jgi:citronellyl-CoA dehydrogenase
MAEWLAETEALRQLTYHIVRMKENRMDVTQEISMGKLLAGNLINKVTDGCLQMHGGMGFMNETWISRAYRDSRLLAIGGGASEVMSEIIFKMAGY